MSHILKEKTLLLAILTFAIIYPLEHTLVGFGPWGIGLTFTVIMAVVLTAAFSVAHHAEILAHKYGEPYGTLILTGAAVGVEVIILAILLQSAPNPTLVRDTIYAALMLDINGIIGIAAIVGGIKHGQQKYNVDSSNSYIAMILVAVGITMVIPDFIGLDAVAMYSVFNIVVISALYALFTRIQIVEHRYFFEYTPAMEAAKAQSIASGKHIEANGRYHIALLIALIVAIGALAEVLSVFLNEGISQAGLPILLAGVVVALISASPEILTAMRAALDNRMQTVVNIALGASLATVLMTIPVMETIALITDIPLTMGLTATQGAMILLTMLVAMVNLNNGETNALEGMVHAVLFFTFVMLIFVIH
ncbi:MAG: calcium:proton antiporter [Gammaproteobacteria bacterium]